MSNQVSVTKLHVRSSLLYIQVKLNFAMKDNPYKEEWIAIHTQKNKTEDNCNSN